MEKRLGPNTRKLRFQGIEMLRIRNSNYGNTYGLQSKIPASPVIRPEILPYVIPYITSFKEFGL